VKAGAAPWNPALAGAMTAAVDDLKILVRAVRAWSPADAQRAATRTAELSRYAPAATPTTSVTPGSTSGGGFFATEAANIAAGLELLATRPTDRAAAGNVLRRVRALRGVAGIKDAPPLAEIMEAAELISRPLELGEGGLDAERITLLRAAAALLRRVAGALRDGTPPNAPSGERDAFFTAFQTFQENEADSQRIVPITDLFYGDTGPQLVTAAPHPPTSPTERFRLEVVSQGEHLLGLVAESRQARDPQARERVQRELRQALRSLRNDAESFGEQEVAELIASHYDAVNVLDYLSLNALEALAGVLASPGAQGERLAARLSELKQGRSVDTSIGAAFGADSGERTPAGIEVAEPRLSAAIRAMELESEGQQKSAAAPNGAPRRHSAPVSSTAPTPIVTPAIRASAAAPTSQQAPRSATIPTAAPFTSAASSPQPSAPLPTRPTASPKATPHMAMPHSTPGSLTPAGAPRVSTPRDTMAVLNQGIDSLHSLATHPMADVRALPDQPAIPIEALLYRGRSAIERAIELRQEIMRHGNSPSAEALDELFDLLDLALVE
jgi:chemotaxis protein histidine kinase CheA